MIFLLSWGTYDGGSEYYFEGPADTTLGDFKVLCDQLMNEAAINLINNKSVRFPDSPCTPCIGYQDLVWEVVAMLPAYNYSEVKLPEVKYRHGIIINNAEDDEDKVFSEDLVLKIAKHNEKLRRR